METDPVLQNIVSSEVKTAKEFLTNWLPYLSKDLCGGCESVLLERIHSLNPVNKRKPSDPQEEVDCGMMKLDLGNVEVVSDVAGDHRASHEGWEHVKATGWDTDPEPESPKVRMSWADMVQEDQLEEEKEDAAKRYFLENVMEEGKEDVRLKKSDLCREQRERINLTCVGRKNDFVCLERIDGRIVNILEGLELHTGVFNTVEQTKAVDFVYELQEQVRNNELGEHSYSKEFKSGNSMLGKGHTTIQFGCYSSMEHSSSRKGNIHGIVADPVPKFFKVMIKKLIDRHVIPASCEPDNCRVNIYEPGDFGPPDISSRDFERPFCTVAFLNECRMKFGPNLVEDDAGEIIGSAEIPIPVGSALLLNGKGADVAKHYVPANPSKRIMITFWRTEKRFPSAYRLEPDLQVFRPYDLSTDMKFHRETNETEAFAEIRTVGSGRKFNGRSIGAKFRHNSKKVEGSVFDRLTPISRAFFPDGADEVPGRSRRRWKNDDGRHYIHNEVSSERSVRADEERIIITRNLCKEDEFGGISSPTHSQIRIRASKNNQRSVRMIQ